MRSTVRIRFSTLASLILISNILGNHTAFGFSLSNVKNAHCVGERGALNLNRRTGTVAFMPKGLSLYWNGTSPKLNPISAIPEGPFIKLGGDVFSPKSPDRSGSVYIRAGLNQDLKTSEQLPVVFNDKNGLNFSQIMNCTLIN